jgi:hypothetical protein
MSFRNIPEKSETKKRSLISVEYYSSQKRFAVPLLRLSQLAFSVKEPLLPTIFTTAKKFPLLNSSTVCTYPPNETIPSH